MENASKALIMTGGVFIAIVILVIGIESFVQYRKVAETYDANMTMSEITEINKEFTKYLEKGNNITIQEVVTAIRTAQNYNEKYGYKMIEVKINGSSKINYKNKDFANLIKSVTDNGGKKYKVSTPIVYYTNSTDKNQGVIKEINFGDVP